MTASHALRTYPEHERRVVRRTLSPPAGGPLLIPGGGGYGELADRAMSSDILAVANFQAEDSR